MREAVPIFLVTEEMNSPHGTEMLAAVLLEGLVRRGHPVHLFAARYDRRRSHWTAFLQEHRVAVTHPGFWFFSGRHWPQRYCVRLLRRAARAIRPALVMSLDNGPFCCRALEAWDLEDVPFFVHDPNEASSRCPHYDPLWFRVCHRICGLSVHGLRQAHSARTYYELNRPIEVIWPACRTPRRDVHPAAGESPPLRFGLFGRLHSQKGAYFAIAAMRKVLNQGGRCELHLYGDGPMRALAEELTASLGLEQVVFFHGEYPPDRLDDLVEQIDVGLMPSLYEGFGIVMLELMARGRPVISTDVGSSREVIGALGGGVIVERADTEGLAEAMLSYCRRPDLLRDHGKRGREIWQEHFTIDAMVGRYLRFWAAQGARIHAHPKSEAAAQACTLPS